MRRFFCQSIPEVGQEAELPDEEAKHLRTVLRNAGGRVEILDGQGTRATAEIVPDSNRRRARCRVLSRTNEPQPSVRLHLYVSPPRAKQMSQLVRQATELGIWSIRPIITERSVADPKGSAASWLAQAREALKQSGNPWLPQLHSPVEFAVALADAPPGWTGAPAYLEQRRPDTITGPDQAIWIGPEGGFTEAENKALAAVTCPVTVGDWILRVETAVVGVITAVHLHNSRSST